MEYFIYENWRHKKAVIHKADCSQCNYGRGVHIIKSKIVSGHWLGPFKDKQEAELAARKTKRKNILNCSRCL